MIVYYRKNKDKKTFIDPTVCKFNCYSSSTVLGEMVNNIEINTHTVSIIINQKNSIYTIFTHPASPI